jgi:hypothetical protein
MIWIEQIFDIEVEHKEIPRPGGKPYLLMAPNQVGVLHTTEGLGIDNAWATLNAHHSAPHFIVGDNRIIQCRPLGVQSAALLDTPLHPNKDAFIQIEMVGFTGGSRDYAHHAMDSWMPVDTTLNPLSKLMAFAAQKGYVPLKRAYAWSDDCKDIKGVWATAKNSRRLQNIYGHPQYKGWFYHLEVPGNSHYDCGGMRFMEVTTKAQALMMKTISA